MNKTYRCSPAADCSVVLFSASVFPYEAVSVSAAAHRRQGRLSGQRADQEDHPTKDKEVCGSPRTNRILVGPTKAWRTPSYI